MNNKLLKLLNKIDNVSLEQSFVALNDAVSKRLEAFGMMVNRVANDACGANDTCSGNIQCHGNDQCSGNIVCNNVCNP